MIVLVVALAGVPLEPPPVPVSAPREGALPMAPPPVKRGPRAHAMPETAQPSARGGVGSVALVLAGITSGAAIGLPLAALVGARRFDAEFSYAGSLRR